MRFHPCAAPREGEAITSEMQGRSNFPRDRWIGMDRGWHGESSAVHVPVPSCLWVCCITIRACHTSTKPRGCGIRKGFFPEMSCVIIPWYYSWAVGVRSLPGLGIGLGLGGNDFTILASGFWLPGFSCAGWSGLIMVVAGRSWTVAQ